MTEASKKKEEAKKNIRSLLQSAQGGRTLQELKCDFRDFFFSELPGKAFGYNSPEDFLKDIPDVCEISYSNGAMVFRAVANASTAHIQRLVSLNKPSKKVAGRRRHTPAPFLSKTSRFSQAPRFQRSHFCPPKPVFQNGPPMPAATNSHVDFSRQHVYDNQAHHNRPAYHSASSRSQARHKTVPIIPAFIQGQIHEMLDSNPHGLPLTHFCRVFKLRFKVPLDPSQMGFQDEHSMLASIPNIATLKRFPQGEVRVIPASVRPTVMSHSKHETVTSPTRSNDNTNHIASPPSFNEESPKYNTPQDQSAANGSTDCWNELFKNQTCNIPNHIQDNIQKLIEKRPQGIYASSIASMYKDQFREMLQIKSYGYNSVIDFVSDLGHIVVIERPNPQGDWLLYPVGSKSQPKAVTESQLESQCVFLPVEDEVKECICQVLGAHPAGILLDRFPDMFKEMTGTSLQIEKYGQGNLRQFLHSLSDILNIVLDASDQLKVSAKFQQTPRRFDKLIGSYHPTTTAVEETPQLNLDLPVDVVTPGCYYKPLGLPQMGNAEENYVELYVSFVITPSCFWIQLRGERTTLALEELMDDLERQYNDKANRKYHMPLSLAKEGTLCVAIYPEDGFWYRGIILGSELPLYKIYYVDYGNTCTVTIDNIRLLKRRFMKLPAQAIKARLSNIQPLTQKWTIRARDRMLEMCREIPLIGLVAGVKERTLSLCLTDTRGQDDIHINDMLVMEKYAKFVPDNQNTVDEAQTAVQLPSSQMLFGEMASSDSEAANSGGPVRRYVRQAQVNDQTILNLINLGGLHLLTGEISALFFSEDIISSMLIKDNAKIQKVVVTKTNYPDLFNELLQYETPWVTESTTRLGLYSLSALPLIIDLYGAGKDLDDLKDVVLEVLDWFDIDDPYWKGEDDVATGSEGTDPQQDSQSVVSDSSDAITMEDLLQALNILQMKRKQVLRKIMGGEGDVDHLVNELNAYELSIKRVEERKAKYGQDQESVQVSETAKATDKTSTSPKTRAQMNQNPDSAPMASQLLSSSLSALSVTSSAPAPVPQVAAAASTSTAAATSTQNCLPSITPQQSQNMLFNSMYMTSLGLLPNLSQSALHSLSTASMNKNEVNANQMASYMQQPTAINEGLASVPAATGQHLANLGLLANQNITQLMPGVGRGFGLPQYTGFTPSQMMAFNQALYNSQLMAMSGGLLSQAQASSGSNAANPRPPSQAMMTSGLSGLPSKTAAKANGAYPQNVSNSVPRNTSRFQ